MKVKTPPTPNRAKGFFLLLLFLSLIPFLSSAQTPGLIFQPATGTGRNVLDPNLDNYVSKLNTGYSNGVDIGASVNEIGYRLLPQYGSEVLNDLATGAGGGHTDLAPNPLYMAFNGTQVLFRVRLAGNSTASKGYSILIDSDGVFNKQRLANGALIDYTTPSKVTNVGFEYEVVLALNFDVVVYRHRGSGNDGDPFTSNVIWRGSANGGYSQYFQKAIAASTAGGNADYFFDFYVPLSAFSADAGGGISASTPLRITGSTVTSAQTGLEGTISDVGGVNDKDTNYQNDKYKIWRDVIPAFPPTSLNQIQNGEFCQSAAPSAPVLSAVRVGTSSVSGTSSEIGGTITLFRNGTQIISSSAVIVAGSGTSGTFNFPLPNGTTLAAGDVLTVRVTRTASGNCPATSSVSSNSVTVGSQEVPNCTTTPAPTIVTFNSNQQTATVTSTVNVGASGSNLGTLKIYRDGVNFPVTYPAPTSATANGVTTYTYTVTPSPGCNGNFQFSYVCGSNNASNNYGTITATIIPAGGCESPRSASLYLNANTSATTTSGSVTTAKPTITSTFFCTATTTNLTGTAPGGSNIYLFVNYQPVARDANGNIAPITTASASGTWSINLATYQLKANDIVNVRAKSTNLGLSEPSNLITINANCETTAPIISSTAPCPTVTSISGTSTEADGTTVIVYRRRSGFSDLRITDAATVSRTTSTATTGNWTAQILPGITLLGGDILYAIATAPGGKTASAIPNTTTNPLPSSATTVQTPATAASLGLVLNAPIKERATVITGTSTTNGTIYIYIDGQRINGTATVSGATSSNAVSWSVAITAANQQNISTGAPITASISTGSGCESQHTNPVLVSCNAPATTPTIAPASQVVCNNSPATITISNSQDGVIYQIYNGSTPSGPSMVGNGGTISVFSGNLTSAAVLTVRAFQVGSADCQATLNGSSSVTIKPTPLTYSVTPTSQTVCNGATATVSLSSSEQGATYQIQVLNAATGVYTNTGSSVAGTGNAITLNTAAVTSSGTFKVVATKDGCSIDMGNTFNVTVPSNSLTISPSVQSVCSNNTASVVIAGSESGVTYQIQRISGTAPNFTYTNRGAAVTSTGGNITLTTDALVVLGANNFRILATASGCSSFALTQQFSVNVTSSTPTTYTVTPATQTVCSGQSATINLSGSEPGITYQIFNGSSAVGSTVAGTGSAITLLSGAITTGGTFTVVATNSCGSRVTMSGNSVVTINPVPTAFAVTPTTQSICNNATANISLAGSETGVSYQLMVYNPATATFANTGSAVAGTGNALTLTTAALTASSNLKVVATRTTNSVGCSVDMSNLVFVSVPSSSLTISAVTPVICSGGTAQIRVSASEVDVNYQLFINGVANGSIVEGIGGDITLTSATISSATTFTVRATPINPTGCTAFQVGNSVTVNVQAPSNQTSALTSSSSVCSGSTATINLTSSEAGVTYQIFINGTVATGFGVAGTGSSISLTSDALTSTASLQVYAIRSGCSNTAIGSAYTITVTQSPSPFTFTSSEQVVCSGGTVQITLPNSQNGVEYQIFNGSTASGTRVTSTGGAITLTSGALTTSTTLSVQAIGTGSCGNTTMDGYVSVTVSPTPLVTNINASTSKICGNGSNVTFTATTNLVNGVTYRLALNGTPFGSSIVYNGSNTVTFTTSVTSTGTYTIVASSTNCPTATSAPVTVNVYATPIVYNVTPASLTVCSGSSATITLSNAESGVTYQIYNGANTSGTAVTATGTGALTLTSATLSSNAVLTVKAFRSDCPAVEMSGSTTVTVSPKPVAPTIAANSNNVCGTSNVTINVTANLVNEVTYQLYRNGVAEGSSVKYTGSNTVSFTTALSEASTKFTVVASSTSCSSATSNELTVTFTPAFTANAGPDKSVCSTNDQGSKSVTLEATAASTGTSGNWTVVSKPTGSGDPVFADASNPTTSVSGLHSGNYVFKWTVSSTSCGSQTDEVTITLDCEAEVVSSMQPKAVSEYQNEDVLFIFGDSDAPIMAYSNNDNYSIPGVLYQIVNGQLRMYVSNRTALVADLYYPSITTTDANGGTSTLSPTVIIGTPLPVSLTSFRAYPTNTGIQLTWSTASEKDNERFDIERSKDARNFTKIGQIAGSGNSSVVKNYTFTDANPITGTAYYRLKQVDMDGKFEYSRMISLQSEMQTVKSASLSVVPNPFSQTLSLTFTSEQEGTVQIDIISLQSKYVFQETIKLSSGTTLIKRELHDLPAGIYLMKVNGAGLNVTQKIIKVD